MIDRSPPRTLTRAGDLKALCVYMLEVCENDPTEAWLVLQQLANRDVRASELAEHLTPEELGKISKAVRDISGLR